MRTPRWAARPRPYSRDTAKYPGGEIVEGQPVQDQPVVQRRRWVIPVVAIIIVLLIIAAAFLVLVGFKPKLQIELWNNSDGHYGGTEPDLDHVLQVTIHAYGQNQGQLSPDPTAVCR